MRYNFLLGLLASETFAGSDKCRGLALSGGANYGAWEAGVVWGLTHYGNPEDFKWNIITGVSAGGINTAATTVWNVGDEVKMAEFLSDAWANLTTQNIWVNWPGGPVAGLLTKQGIFDTSPAIEFFTNLLGPFGTFSDRQFAIASANVDTGDYEIFTQDNIAFEDIATIAMASGSIPTVFPNQHYKGMNLMDGGTIWDVNVDSAVNACLNMGYSQEDIIIDTLVCSYTEMPTETDVGNTVNNFAQSFHIHGALNNGDAIAEQERAYPNVNYRYYI